MSGGGELAAGGGLLLTLLPWLGLLVLLILIGGAIAILIRRRMSIDDAPTIGFTLGDLRAMRDRGEISDEEFEQAREKMVTAVRGDAPSRVVQTVRPSASGISGGLPPRRTESEGPRNEGPRGSSPDSENH